MGCKECSESIRQIVEKSQTSLDQVDWFIPHSANLRLIEPICEKLEYPMEKTLYSLVNFEIPLLLPFL